ncbi:MAG: SurA N-terminal domain-containing protein [Lentisphaeria bacterium]|nr:SurA N-terminal domain-containing protein [Lentisphaeria bacterium]
MVIRKMNTVLVKHNKILFGVFSVIIIISFVWFFTPGLDGSLLFGGAGASPNAAVGTVFGKKITNKQYQQAYRDRMLLLEAMTGRDGYQFQNYIEQTLFQEIARETAAEVMGITATDEEVTNFIRNACAVFRGKNGFDPELYRKFAQTIQEREGRSIAEFENLVRRMLAADKLGSELTSGVYLTQNEKENMAVLLKEKFTARLIEFPFSSWKNIKRGSAEAKAKGLSDDDMLNYYKANQKRFMTAPRMKAVIVRFPFAMPNYAPSAKEIQAYYKAHENDFKKNGKLQPLAQVRGKITDSIRREKGREQALQAAKKFRDELYSATESADSAENQLAQLKKLAAAKKLNLIATDWFTAQTEELKGIGKEPALVGALFKTNPKHSPLLHASFQGNNGVYVAGSTAVLPSVPADYKDVQDKVWELLLTDYAKRAASEAAHNFSHLIAGKADAGKELAELAKKAGAKISSLNGFTRETQNETPVRMFAMQLAVRQQDKTISRPEEAADGMILVYLDERRPPSSAEKAEALKQIDAMLKYSKQMMQQGSLSAWLQANVQSNLRNRQE